MTTAAAALIARREYTICSSMPKGGDTPRNHASHRPGVYSHRGWNNGRPPRQQTPNEPHFVTIRPQDLASRRMRERM